MSPAVTVVSAVAWGALALWLIVRIWKRTRGPVAKRPRRSYGGAMTAGAIYDLLNEDRRKALEIIVEQRAEARDPEDTDGNLPDLEDPRASR
jgi:hypothetical protein